MENPKKWVMDYLSYNDKELDRDSLREIRELPEYKQLMDLGVLDTTTPIIQRNGNIRLEHPQIMGEWTEKWTGKRKPGTVTVYREGPIRVQISDVPNAMRGSDVPREKVQSIDDWSEKLNWVREYMVKKLLRDRFEIGSRVEQDRMASGELGISMGRIAAKYPENFLEWIDEVSEEAKETILKSLQVADQKNMKEIAKWVDQNPVKAVFSLKKLMGTEFLKELIPNLNPSIAKDFEENIDIVGSLDKLGF